MSKESSTQLIISSTQATALDKFDPSILDTVVMGVPLRGKPKADN
jgi:hypothetical protein